MASHPCSNGAVSHGATHQHNVRKHQVHESQTASVGSLTILATTARSCSATPPSLRQSHTRCSLLQRTRMTSAIGANAGQEMAWNVWILTVQAPLWWQTHGLHLCWL